MSERDDVDLDPPSAAEPSDTDAARKDAALDHRRHRRRLAAAIANFLAPGAGHMAILRYRRGLAWMAATLALGALMIAWTHIATILLAFLGTRAGSVIDGWRLPISNAALMPTRLPVPSWLLLMFGYVLIALVTRTYALEAFKIPSGAMIPTLQIGDHVFVNKLAYRFGEPSVTIATTRATRGSGGLCRSKTWSAKCFASGGLPVPMVRATTALARSSRRSSHSRSSSRVAVFRDRLR